MRKILVTISIIVLVFSLGFSQFVGLPRETTLITTGPRASSPGNFNVFVTTWRTPNRGIQQLMLEPLWTMEPARGEVINSLAVEGPIYNDDFTKMTVKLREGCYWSDGVEITADDIVYGIETTMKYPGMAYYDQLNLYVDSIYKIDNYTVVFELKEPNARFHANFVDRWGGWRPFPKHIFEKVEDPLSFDFNPPISSGPYVLKDYDRAGYWTLWEKRKDWDRTPTGIMFGEPQPSYVLFYSHLDETNAIIAQINHNLDVAEPNVEGFKVLLNRNSYSRGYREQYPWIVNVDPCITGLTLNNEKYPYNIKDVRWALTLAIDIIDYIAIAYDGAAVMGALHIPPIPFYQEIYYEPMEEWLKNFTLDIEVNGELFKPYDSSATLRAAQYAKERGYKVPDDIDELKEMFGPGWWKYAPDVAEQLLIRNGFKRDRNGKWLLPDGTPWKITILSDTSSTGPRYKNAIAAAQQWRNFGINVEIVTSEGLVTESLLGNFDVSVSWPAMEAWGGHADLHRVFNVWHSKYYKSIGEYAVGNDGAPARWADSRMDEVIDKMEKLDWDDPRNLELGMEGLKILIEEMPTIPTFGYPGIIAWDEYFWTNWPGAENPYMIPYAHWPNFKYLLPFLEPTGRK
ncbi:ABC transporter substrate-binding protein [Petrotoga sp. 9PWA.NaAc.5.4]|uniref:ABC transporter substrate-binding protein n=1 Tax=Petrotoga sp. 9PWA.NaAc.5.4 TaxID=1434328 RepID=UPI000CBE03AA|nr:ABC transporter substrate-binding protein [Petrotoga sp. 9PWA.NaAc.5.4]PNR94541.1 peptide ABC transporter substrate-binding protein [Petrotoga sp. 9PWA.NaAc.5.4]